MVIDSVNWNLWAFHILHFLRGASGFSFFSFHQNLACFILSLMGVWFNFFICPQVYQCKNFRRNSRNFLFSNLMKWNHLAVIYIFLEMDASGRSTGAKYECLLFGMSHSSTQSSLFIVPWRIKVALKAWDPESAPKWSQVQNLRVLPALGASHPGRSLATQRPISWVIGGIRSGISLVNPDWASTLGKKFPL